MRHRLVRIAYSRFVLYSSGLAESSGGAVRFGGLESLS
jgi:hypothetical protein